MRAFRLVALLLLFAGIGAYSQVPLPDIPRDLTTPTERADYLALHFYDAMDWQSSAMTSENNLTQDWANFLSVLPHCSDAGRERAVTATIHSVPASLLPTYGELADTYLFAADSELCDDATYLMIYRAIATSPVIDEGYRKAVELRLDYMLHAAPGDIAPDIEVSTLDDSATCRLHELAGKGKNLIIVFFDPECDDCHEALATVATDKFWTDAQASGQVLVVKTEITEDKESLYAILTVPSIYLLDGSTLTVKARNLPLSSIAAHLQ